MAERWIHGQSTLLTAKRNIGEDGDVLENLCCPVWTNYRWPLIMSVFLDPWANTKGAVQCWGPGQEYSAAGVLELSPRHPLFEA